MTPAMQSLYTPMLLCALGWLLHWFGSWGEAWKLQRVSLPCYLVANMPAFLFSTTATVALYLIGPSAFNLVGLDLSRLSSDQAAVVADIAALMTGYMSDSLVSKIFSLVRPK